MHPPRLTYQESIAEDNKGNTIRDTTPRTYSIET